MLGHNQVLIVVFNMYTQLRYVRNASEWLSKGDENIKILQVQVPLYIDKC